MAGCKTILFFCKNIVGYSFADNILSKWSSQDIVTLTLCVEKESESRPFSRSNGWQEGL